MFGIHASHKCLGIYGMPLMAGKRCSFTNAFERFPALLGQILSTVAQQNVSGGRIAFGPRDRTLPHFQAFDYSAASRGFVQSSYVKGLNPVEFFAHGKYRLSRARTLKTNTFLTSYVCLHSGGWKRGHHRKCLFVN